MRGAPPFRAIMDCPTKQYYPLLLLVSGANGDRGYNVPELKKGAIAVVSYSPIGRILMCSIER